jgi:beta-galactosidase
MTFADAVDLYGKYVGDWGGAATTFKFEAIRNGEVVKTVTRSAVTKLCITAKISRQELVEGNTYDAALVRIMVCDQFGNVAPFYSEPVQIVTEGPIEVIGPAYALMRGGMGGTMIRTTGQKGAAKITLKAAQTEDITINLEVK